MARIRFKIELNPGGDGVRLDKLAKITGELEKFLRQLAQDSGIEIKPEEWIARDFYDGSVGATIEYVGENVPPPVAHDFNVGLTFFTSFRPERAAQLRQYSADTLKRFIDLGDVLDAGEVVKLGLMEGDRLTPDWQEISKRATLDVDDAVRDEIAYEGSLQGKLGTWYKESNYFNLKDLSLNAIVKCFYHAAKYDEVYSLYQDRDAIVHISGLIRAERASGRPKEIRLTDIKHYPRLSDHEFSRLFGIAPNMTGGTSTTEYLDRLRQEDDG